MLPSGQALGFQQMRVGEQEADSTLDNALSMSRLFGLDENQAIKEVRAVARVVDTLAGAFQGAAVCRAHDIELYARADRPAIPEGSAEA